MLEIAELNDAERVTISRRRARIDNKPLTIAAAAKLFGVTDGVFRSWENPKSKSRTPAPLPGDVTTVADLRPYERCYLARVRSGLKAKDVAAELGLSDRWLTKAERGEQDDIEALVNYWRMKAVLS